MRTVIPLCALVLLSFPATAKVRFPASIPGECVELAQREGVPTVINSKYEVAKARVKLARLRDSDPLVHQCREAVARAKESYQANGAVN
jgi:hypothetical protein